MRYLNNTFATLLQRNQCLSEDEINFIFLDHKRIKIPISVV